MVKRVFINIFVCLVSLSVFCQSNDSVQSLQSRTDSLAVGVSDTLISIAAKDSIKTDLTTKKDTVSWVDDKMEIDKSTQKLLESTKPFKPDPTKAVLYSAIFPGLGQIYNQKYWKLPIVYGGFIGFVYAITWNGRLYNDYTDAYTAIMSDNWQEQSDVWLPFFQKGVTVEQVSERLDTYRTSFKSRRDFTRRNRDLSIIGAIALYALCMIDAYVDAQLYDFDISPNLSFRVEPRVGLDVFSQKTIGVQCSVKF